MAIRSEAGTGLKVSLVVFILTTFFLLTLTIVFYSKQADALEAEAEARKTLTEYIRPAERNNEAFKSYEDAAKSAGQSVAAHLHGQKQSIMEYVVGTPGATIAQMKSDFARLGVGEESVVRAEFQDTRGELDDANNEIDRLQVQLQAWEDDNAEMRAQMDQLRQSHQQEIDGLQAQISQYRQAAITYGDEVEDVKNDMLQRVDSLEQEFEQRSTALQREIDQYSEERVVFIRRIQELEAKIRQNQILRPDPSLLVDGRVIDSAEVSDQVFIDRGRDHRIVLGMKFEVYDDAAALRQVDRLTGELPRGKASLEVIKVGQSTSTCKITRSVPGRPVVREDVIANAVYDPSYEFKFLVHGKFDVDGDGRPSEAEAEYIRSLVVDWGGQIVTGETLPGDLDFLVLGVEPPQPAPLADDASSIQTQIWIRQRQARETYLRLQQQAIDAQIPVLNHNRFFILTGYTIR